MGMIRVCLKLFLMSVCYGEEILVVVIVVPLVTMTMTQECLRLIMIPCHKMIVNFGEGGLAVEHAVPFVTMTMMHACLVLRPLLVTVSFGPMLHMDREGFPLNLVH